jgi:methyl-accepting chemotaxis protein
MKPVEVNRSRIPWALIAKIGGSAAFFFWFYMIWNSSVELHEQIKTTSDHYSAVHQLQVEYKNEVQEWKNVLLRSNNQETLNQQWLVYDNQHMKVASAAQDALAQSDVRYLTENLKSFVEAHTANYQQYKNSVQLLLKNRFDPTEADAAVKSIDRPLLDYLQNADTAAQDETRRLNETLAYKSRTQIEQSLVVLAFLAMLVIWFKH